MNAAAAEAIFLPGFDGEAGLREEFVMEIGRCRPARAIGYPRRTLGSLDAYVRHARAQAAPDSRKVLVAESFSGLVATRWAAGDPNVLGVVLCGGFARRPLSRVPMEMAAAMPWLTRFLGCHFMARRGMASADPARRRWSAALFDAIAALPNDVVRERMRLIASEDIGADLARLAQRVVLLQFEEDAVVGRAARDYLESVCAGATVVRFPGRHSAIETRPADSARALAAPLERLFAAAA